MEGFVEIPDTLGSYGINKDGQVIDLLSGNKRKSVMHNTGYFYVLLSVGGSKKFRFVHRLLASTFIPNPECKSCINHKNGIKTDNSIDNLEWVTVYENVRHSVASLGNGGSGKVKPIQKIDANGIKTVYKNIREAGRQSGISYNSIMKVLKGSRKKSAGCEWSYAV